MTAPVTWAAPDGAELRADCGRCFALCCVAPAFARSQDFGLDKPAGRRCPHLTPGSRCGIHSRLRERGFAGCDAFDCLGAGQKLSQLTLDGTDPWADPHRARLAVELFPVMRQLHELLRYLAEAVALDAAAPLRVELEQARDRVDAATRSRAPELGRVGVEALRRPVRDLLVRASALARAGLRGDTPSHHGARPGADLVGARLRGADLRGADLRGAHLIGADLRDADLRRADLLGADLRGARLHGADLAGCLFLTRPQLTSATGDGRTRLSPGHDRPGHWPLG